MPFFCIHWIWAANFSANVLDTCVHFALVGRAVTTEVSLFRCLNCMSFSHYGMSL